MNQDKISNFIKNVRLKSNLSQEKFGKKYGVTYQAVSKWENGKNIPDIAILKEICKDYNKDINELLDNPKRKLNYFKWLIIGVIILIIILGIEYYHYKIYRDSFEFKTIKTTCDDFNLSGSIAYDKNKTSIYISDISYCGVSNEEKYKDIICTMYEVDKNSKKKITSYNYDKNLITLDDFLKEVKFKVDHYSESCQMYKKNGLLLEIEAINSNDQKILYEIPLELEDNC